MTLDLGYNRDGADHGKILPRVLRISRKEKLKQNRDKFHFRHTSIPFLGEIISRHEA